MIIKVILLSIAVLILLMPILMIMSVLFMLAARIFAELSKYCFVLFANIVALFKIKC